jgi:hypothetical protein
MLIHGIEWEIKPYVDLKGADLREANLRETDLRETDLSGANLRGANLRGANLFRANLSETDLSETDLRGANLFRASLFRANLSGATLRGENLRGASLFGAKIGPYIIASLCGRAFRSDGHEFLQFKLQPSKDQPEQYLIRAGCRTYTPLEFCDHVAGNYPNTPKATETLLILNYLAEYRTLEAWS